MFFLINIISSILTTFLVCYFGNIIQHSYDFYIPILLFIAFLIGYIALTFILIFMIAIPVKRKTEFNQKDSKFYRFLMEHMFTYLNTLGLVRIHFEGKEKIEKGKKLVYVCNHRSKFDPMVISDKLKGYNIAWIAKKSLFKMPLVSNYMYKSNFLSLDRDDLRQGLRVIEKAVEYISEGQNSIGVFPEGTRNTTKDKLLPFKSGSFKISLLAKTDIVVMAVLNTELIAKRWPLKSTKVYVRVCEVIKYDDIKDLTSYEVANKVHEIMEKNIIEMKNNI